MPTASPPRARARPDPRLLRDVLDGLAATPRTLPAKYFYDTEGSRLFEVGTFVNHGRTFGKQESPAAGVITAFARVAGRCSPAKRPVPFPPRAGGLFLPGIHAACHPRAEVEGGPGEVD